MEELRWTWSRDRSEERRELTIGKRFVLFLVSTEMKVENNISNWSQNAPLLSWEIVSCSILWNNFDAFHSASYFYRQKFPKGVRVVFYSATLFQDLSQFYISIGWQHLARRRRPPCICYMVCFPIFHLSFLPCSGFFPSPFPSFIPS